MKFKNIYDEIMETQSRKAGKQIITTAMRDAIMDFTTKLIKKCPECGSEKIYWNKSYFCNHIDEECNESCYEWEFECEFCEFSIDLNGGVYRSRDYE